MENNLLSVLLWRMRHHADAQAAGIPKWVTITIILVVIGGIGTWMMMAGKKK
ncbi:MAG TPA: hypothetical protein VK177_11410 [Flavobacteriales bacterium]|nr:hypothetical protein [Flavobacteriales bacterium]